ncbi:serpin peptidase inhibitor, clade G (C1 inhibitor), member 1 precursor-like [Scleropages formosus]|uniref:Serpin peptidase inhibitor, clade G (C1 inhibitor), member 1-like n=1 Tax=Scleropages formosus TaxID=113540 RepID=A0A0P7UHV0_SCLFO|nr:serpin peptidase inhibitor, clade G (C1 inhibitor), member 1 precursor-like [Scleropages formosus]
MSASTTLRILSLLLFAELSLSATDLYVTLGSTLVLHCIPPNYTEIGPKDAGLYECVTEGWVQRWGDERKMRLKAAFFVHITESTDLQQEELLDVERGDSITLACSSAPQSSSILITWHREVQSGKEELDLGLESEGGANGSRRIHWAPPNLGPWAIKVNDVTAEDSGVYRCSWQEHGVLKNHTMELVVKGKFLDDDSFLLSLSLLLLLLYYRATSPTPQPPPRCHGYTTPWETCKAENSRSGKAILVESLTEFSMHLYSLLSKSNPSSNLLFSPISIAGVLTNLLLGARGQTRTSLERALHLPSFFSCLHSEMKNLRQELKENVEIASQIYYHAGGIVVIDTDLKVIGSKPAPHDTHPELLRDEMAVDCCILDKRVRQEFVSVSLWMLASFSEDWIVSQCVVDVVRGATSPSLLAELKLEETFANQSEVLYGSRPQRLSENGERNVDMINAWVADKTHQRIKHLVKSLPSSAQLVVLNTIYFNGKWLVKFQQRKELAEFLTSSGDLVPVPVLYSSKYKMALSYSKELDAQVWRRISAGKVSARLFVLLPNTLSSRDLEALESKMDESNIRGMVKSMESVTPETVEVTLPIMKLDISTDLMGLLEDMGTSRCVKARPNSCPSRCLTRTPLFLPGLSDLFGSPNLCGLSAEDTAPPLPVHAVERPGELPALPGAVHEALREPVKVQEGEPITGEGQGRQPITGSHQLLTMGILRADTEYYTHISEGKREGNNQTKLKLL